MVKKKKSQATARKQEKVPLLPMAKSKRSNKTQNLKKNHQKLSLQPFQLNKSTQFSYQHHFITVINLKAHGYLLTI